LNHTETCLNDDDGGGGGDGSSGYGGGEWLWLWWLCWFVMLVVMMMMMMMLMTKSRIFHVFATVMCMPLTLLLLHRFGVARGVDFQVNEHISFEANIGF
jgi:hypothetical protein